MNSPTIPQLPGLRRTHYSAKVLKRTEGHHVFGRPSDSAIRLPPPFSQPPRGFTCSPSSRPPSTSRPYISVVIATLGSQEAFVKTQLYTFCLTAEIALGASVAAAAGSGSPWVPASDGCPMAHCDLQMSDRNPIPAPPGPVEVIAHDGSVHGSGVGLGCSSNGTTAVCSFTNGLLGATEPPFVAAYDARGARLWDAGNLLGPQAFASAPIVDAFGGAIAADDQNIIRFDKTGHVIWQSPLIGLPISPVPIEDRVAFVATREVSGTDAAPLFAYDMTDGTLLQCLRLGLNGSVAAQGDDCLQTTSSSDGAFSTVNTPGGRGSRVYVSTALVLADGTADPAHRAKLYAIDVDPDAPAGSRLTPAWTFDFTGPSGASPLVIGNVVYFDGAGTADDTAGPFFFAVRDAGDHGELVWRYSLAKGAQASAAQDPRGGLWVFGAGDSTLIRLGEQPDAQGAAVVMQTIDVAKLIPLGRPASAMSIAGGADHPVMLVSSTSPLPAFRGLLLAIDLSDGELQWHGQGGSHGQFPVMRAEDGASVVVVPTASNGVSFLR
jgi:hypothetical protein